MNKTIQDNKEHIIFLPGWGFKSSIWHSIGVNLNNKNIIYCDLPKLTSSNNQLETISNYLVSQIPPNSIIIAWSISGLVSIHLCHKYPNICKKLILVASKPKFTTITNDFIIATIDNITIVFNQFIRLIQYPNHKTVIRKKLKANLVNIHQEKDSLLQYLNLLHKTNLSDIFDTLTQEILTIQGDQDLIIPIKSTLRNTKIIRGAGHAPFLTNRISFSNALQTFIEL